MVRVWLTGCVSELVTDGFLIWSGIHLLGWSVGGLVLAENVVPYLMQVSDNFQIHLEILREDKLLV